MKEWLNRAFYAEKKVKALDELIKQSRERARGLSGSNGNGKGKSDTRTNGTENALMKLADIEYKYSVQKQELVEVTEEISEAIDLLHDYELETVLIHRYLLFHKIEETAELMHYSVRTVNYKQDEAIRKLCEVIPPTSERS